MRNQATWPQGFDISGEVLGQQSSGESAFPEYERLKERLGGVRCASDCWVGTSLEVEVCRVCRGKSVESVVEDRSRFI